MAVIDHHHHLWLSVFGILGNIVSVFIFLAPVSTFIRMCKSRSTLGFHSVSYNVLALYSCMSWVYYAIVKKNATFLISINSIGVLTETIYVLIFLFFASNQARCRTLKELLLCIGGFFFIFWVSWFTFSGAFRVSIVGWITAAISMVVYASPLTIVVEVLQTRSVEFLPIYMSFFSTLNAMIWFGYGLLLEDWFIALPNISGYFLGFVQILLYVLYWEPNPIVEENENVAEHVMNVEMSLRLNQMVHPVDSRRSFSNATTETNPEADHQGE